MYTPPQENKFVLDTDTRTGAENPENFEFDTSTGAAKLRFYAAVQQSGRIDDDYHGGNHSQIQNSFGGRFKRPYAKW